MLFKEEQKFGKWKIIPILLIAVIGLFILLLREGFETRPNSIVLACVLVFVSLVGVLILKSKLETSIDKYAIRYRFFPFISNWKRIEKEHIQQMEVVKYSPIADYGGYGYRFSFRNGRALNTGGNKGLKIVYNQNKKLLIGTKKPAELEQAINEFLAVNKE